MPIYTYKCDSCENIFEKRQRMTDEPLQECILCNEGQVRRVINSVGIVFKGNGFYVTDSRQKNGVHKESKDKEKKGAANGTAESAKSEAVKPEKKPAAATESAST